MIRHPFAGDRRERQCCGRCIKKALPLGSTKKSIDRSDPPGIASAWIQGERRMALDGAAADQGYRFVAWSAAVVHCAFPPFTCVVDGLEILRKNFRVSLEGLSKGFVNPLEMLSKYFGNMRKALAGSAAPQRNHPHCSMFCPEGQTRREGRMRKNKKSLDFYAKI